MKLLRRNFDNEGGGEVRVEAVEAEDMWQLYNLIHEGDVVKAKTSRKVQRETATGSQVSEKVMLNLAVRVEDIDFDPEGSTIRLKGKNVEENKFVKLGQYHTLELGLRRAFTLRKTEWTSVELERLELAVNPVKSADLAAVLMEPGTANVCLITTNMTLVRAKILVNIPKKRKMNASARDKALTRFFDEVFQAIRKHIDFDVVKAVILASPGFLAEDFLKYMLAKATQHDIAAIKNNKGCFMTVTCPSSHVHDLKTVLANEEVQARVKDTKAAQEVHALNAFFEMMSKEPDRAFYGYKHVLLATEKHAVETLLITDSLFRSNNIVERKKYAALVLITDSLFRSNNIFSSLHVSGEQLAQISGIAAILRFPLPEIEDEADSDSSDDDDGDDDDGDDDDDEEGGDGDGRGLE
ncbi:hypothetical protein PTSG_11088 [Salpingoeca rosetta]|uniref:Protein pelota homolog n=1 Tax=Salpingoeca rosetta (strain ATCC 50818 / BSB-021) TaxID=946362 RepID=F2US38_SALR5|nr:uncharacterized protein PTSG_11088 [Salpingoeca rosetta]EGD80443.1 hypothetical protein PTSG_11088 [Salpingoeca rosetta]|eukprot:XP_004988007.1 hypothetical protein PTSG_11088 [Salpingoeca rosetta]